MDDNADDPASTSSSSDDEFLSNTRRARVLAAQAGTTSKVLATDTRDGTLRKNWAGAPARDLFLKLATNNPGARAAAPATTKGLSEFIRTWTEAFDQRGNVDDRPRTGRHPKVPEVVVALAVACTIETKPATQQAMNKTNCFKSIFNEYDVSHKTLWRRMQQLQPKLGKYVTVEPKKELSAENVDARLETSIAWLKKGVNAKAPGVTKHAVDDDGEVPHPPQHSRSTHTSPYNGAWLTNWALDIIWIDAKTIYIEPKSRKVWGLAGTPSIVLEDPRVMAKSWPLKYYSAVNARFGGILLVFVSGTSGTGYTAAKSYKTQAGKPAKGPTAEEFKDFVSSVKKAYTQRCAAEGINCRPIWSWDNPRIHGLVEKGDWRAEGISSANHAQLPTYSPDMHNVIETSHALICAALQKDINSHKPAPSDTLAMYTDMLQKHFKEILTPKWGLGAVKRLFSKTLPAILSAQGHYPSKEFR